MEILEISRKNREDEQNKYPNSNLDKLKGSTNFLFNLSRYIIPIIVVAIKFVIYVCICKFGSFLLKLFFDSTDRSERYLPYSVIICSIFMIVYSIKPGFMNYLFKITLRVSRLMCDTCSLCVLFIFLFVSVSLLKSYFLLQYDIYFSSES
jgi:hypothetical protein